MHKFSYKQKMNRKRAFALVLAATMVLTGMPFSGGFSAGRVKAAPKEPTTYETFARPTGAEHQAWVSAVGIEKGYSHDQFISSFLTGFYGEDIASDTLTSAISTVSGVWSSQNDILMIGVEGISESSLLMDENGTAKFSYWGVQLGGSNINSGCAYTTPATSGRVLNLTSDGSISDGDTADKAFLLINTDLSSGGTNGNAWTKVNGEYTGKVYGVNNLASDPTGNGDIETASVSFEIDKVTIDSREGYYVKGQNISLGDAGTDKYWHLKKGTGTEEYFDSNSVFTLGEDVTADNSYEVEFEAVDRPAAATVTTAPTSAATVYTGSDQELVIAGTAANGTMVYKLEGETEFSESIPTATLPGTYKVHYKAKGHSVFPDTAIADSAEQVLPVTIDKGVISASSVTAPTSYDQTFNGSNLDLCSAGTATNAHYEYRLGTSGAYSADRPTKRDAGTYTVYYKLVYDESIFEPASGFPAEKKEGHFDTTIEKKEETVTETKTVASLKAGETVSFSLAAYTSLYGTIPSSEQTAFKRRFIEKKDTDYQDFNAVNFSSDGRMINLEVKNNVTDDGTFSFDIGGLELPNAVLTNQSCLYITVDSTKAVDVSVRLSESNYTYNGTPISGVTTTVSRNGQTISGASPTLRYTGTRTDGSSYSSTSAPRDAGTYSVTATIDNSSYMGESYPVSFTIVPAKAYITQPDTYGTLTLNPGDTYPVVRVKDSSNNDITSSCTITYTKDSLSERTYNLSGKIADNALGTYNVNVKTDRNHTFSQTPSVYSAMDKSSFTFAVKKKGDTSGNNNNGNSGGNSGNSGTTPTSGSQNPSEYTDLRTGEVIPSMVYVPTYDKAGNYLGKNSDGTVTITSTNLGASDKTSPAVFAEGAVYRMYNQNSGEHFYTKNPAERNNLAAAGWSYEADQTTKGIAATEDGALPVYRVFNPNTGLHHFTTNKNEAVMLKNIGWRYEGITLYAYNPSANKGTHVYRVYCPFPDPYGYNQHIYTTNAAEVAALVARGYVNEGIAWDVK